MAEKVAAIYDGILKGFIIKKRDYMVINYEIVEKVPTILDIACRILGAANRIHNREKI